MKKLAAALLQAMEEKGHSFQQAADAMAAFKGGTVSKGSVSAWSKGFLTSRPQQENWDTIAHYIGVHPFTVMAWLEVLKEADANILLSQAKGVWLGSAKAIVRAA